MRSETTAGDFDERRYKLFQQRLGVFGKGLWRREWSLYLSPFGEKQKAFVQYCYNVKGFRYCNTIEI